jgi:glyoxylase-like metal-dependent hydrolase (beta-lactamase superfamily II)
MADVLHAPCFSLGDWQTNCYVLHIPPRGGPCWIVDAGFDPQPMIDYIRERDLRLEKILLTHAHVDHIAGLHDLRRALADAPILIHPAERQFLTDTFLNLSVMTDSPVVAPPADGELTPGEPLHLQDLAFEVRHTPGHSPGGVTLYQPNAGLALVGDALFAGSVGRSDFPTSDGEMLIRGIREQLLTLPDATRVLPGHGPETTIGAERRHNPYLN